MYKSRSHFMKTALVVAGGIAIGGTGLFWMMNEGRVPSPAIQGVPPAQAMRNVVSEYRGADDPADLMAMVSRESQNGFTLVMYHATWCPYCKKLTTQAQEAAGMTDTPYNVIKVDVERYPQLAAQAKQMGGVPETFVYLNGQQIDHFGGAARDTRTMAEYMKALGDRHPVAAVVKPYVSTPTPFPKAH